MFVLGVAAWKQQILNNQVDAAVTALFLILVAVVVIANAHVWWQLLAGKRAIRLQEAPYIRVPATTST